jgi:hypothetical protein
LNRGKGRRCWSLASLFRCSELLEQECRAHRFPLHIPYGPN